jgi:hypothetical protein
MRIEPFVSDGGAFTCFPVGMNYLTASCEVSLRQTCYLGEASFGVSDPKGNSLNAPYCIPNELICAEIGRFLGLPIPPTGVVISSHPGVSPWFASLDFNLTGNALPPVDPKQCVAQLEELSAGVLLFDVLVANSDRHRGNLAVDFFAKPPEMNIFDHSHALCGWQAGQAQKRLHSLRNALGITGNPPTAGNRHCLLDPVPTDTYFDKWVGRIQKIPDFFIEDVCQSTVTYGLSGSEVSEVISFLQYRRDNILQIIDQHRAEFTNITQWRLI